MVYNRRRGVCKFPFIMSALAKLPRQDRLLASMPGWACSIISCLAAFPVRSLLRARQQSVHARRRGPFILCCTGGRRSALDVADKISSQCTIAWPACSPLIDDLQLHLIVSQNSPPQTTTILIAGTPAPQQGTPSFGNTV